MVRVQNHCCCISVAGCGLTIHSSRTRFAGRLNSGVSAQKKQISAKSFLDKRHKSFSDPLSPALRHISDLIHLRAVSDLLAPGNLSHPRHRANSQLQRANNSFKPTPLRGVVVTSSHPSVPASDTLPQRRGLIQALAGTRVGFSTLNSATKPRIKGISCVVNFAKSRRPLLSLERLAGPDQAPPELALVATGQRAINGWSPS